MGLVIALAVALAAAGVVLAVGLWSQHSTADPGPECVVPIAAAQSATGIGPAAAVSSTGSDLDLDAVQLQHASTINAVGLARGVPDQARVIALATAFTESGMRNLDHGDLDSVGLFQQRPSQGWGKVAQIMDPVYAAGRFYDALLKVHGWQDMSVTQAAQAVQYSAFPDAYAAWESTARTLATELSGTVMPSLACRAGAQPPTADAPARPTVAGAPTADPALSAVLAAATAELVGVQVVSISTDGRTAVVRATVPHATATVAGRALAAWAVAHGTGFGIDTVRVDGRVFADHAWAAGPAGSVLQDGEVSLSVQA